MGELTPPKLSVLMPVLDAGDFLFEAVSSAVSQLHDGDELVVQDGGSRDGSLDRLRQEYRDDDRVRIVSEPDKGQSDALQRALARAQNPYVGWLNADDVYYPGALDAVRNRLAREPVDVVYGASTVIADGDRVIRRVVPAEFTVAAFVRHGCHVFSGSTFFRTGLVREVGGFDLDLNYAMDFDLFLRVLRGPVGDAQLPVTIGGLRWHSASKGGTSRYKFFREASRIRLAWARTPRERAAAIGQMSYRLALLPLLGLRTSPAFSRWRSARTYRQVSRH